MIRGAGTSWSSLSYHQVASKSPPTPGLVFYAPASTRVQIDAHHIHQMANAMTQLGISKYFAWC
jgi:hypothetical protein